MNTYTNKNFINIGFNLLKSKKIFLKSKIEKSAIIITDKNIYKLHYKTIISTLEKINVKFDKIVLPEGEKNKNIFTLNKIFRNLIIKKCTKKTTLIAFGGGVIGDLTGLASSCYKRGIPFIQIPTTLLSQVDSSIGGKNAINHDLGKNMIGTFKQPKSIIIDLNTLNTLSKRQFSSGIAEIIKYGISLDYIFFCWLEKNLNKLMKREKKTIKKCVQHCCKLKTKIVKIDEKEKHNKRILLNLGHTFGHAIESEFKYNLFLHGEAVSIGIVIALKIAEILGKFCKKKTKRIINLLNKANLPINPPKKMKPKQYLKHIKNDKKNYDKKINLVLPCSIGKVKLFNNVKKKIILKAIKNTYKNNVL